MDLLPAKDVLAAFGDITRANMQNLLNDVALVRGDGKRIEFDVRGFDFEESSALAEAEVLEILMSLDIQSDTLYKLAQIRVSQAYLTDANRAVIEKVTEEINSAPSRSEVQAQQMQAQKLTMDRSLNRATTSLTQQAQAWCGDLVFLKLALLLASIPLHNAWIPSLRDGVHAALRSRGIPLSRTFPRSGTANISNVSPAWVIGTPGRRRF